MAHTCPDCNCLCHCKGDIDDIDLGHEPKGGCIHYMSGDCDGNIDDDFDDDYEDFKACAKCDGHDACADFGCAIEMGLGRMVKKDTPASYDDWS